jgi:hypothetical protein
LDGYVNVRRSVPSVLAAFVVVTLLVTGPLTSVDATRPSATDFDEGTVTADDVAVDTTALRVTAGRFGTGVAYLRVPTATVDVTGVTDRPRLVYRIVIDDLDVSVTETAVVTGSSTYRLDPGHEGLAASAMDRRQYNGTVAVSVQSFSGAETLYQENVTIEVER